MDATRYLEMLRADGARLAEAAAAAGLDTKVPSCPEWTVRDLVTHVGSVYRHKVAALRLGRRPEDGEWGRDAGEQDPVEWFRTGLAEVAGELESRDARQEAYTFYPPDQTVGFWQRRMAQETAVHRIDAELAAEDVTPVEHDLALDGIDEVLTSFLGGPWYEHEPQSGASGSTFAVRAGGQVWRVTLEEKAVPVSRDEGDAVAVVEGEPSDVLLWLWGRPSPSVTVTGDVTELRNRLDLVT